MERRSIITNGYVSYVVTLPKRWCRTNRLKKGDKVYCVSTNSVVAYAASRREYNRLKKILKVGGN